MIFSERYFCYFRRTAVERLSLLIFPLKCSTSGHAISPVAVDAYGKKTYQYKEAIFRLPAFPAAPRDYGDPWKGLGGLCRRFSVCCQSQGGRGYQPSHISPAVQVTRRHRQSSLGQCKCETEAPTVLANVVSLTCFLRRPARLFSLMEYDRCSLPRVASVMSIARR